MSRTVEAPHDLDRCPVCRNEIDPEALLCAACGAEKISINDGKGDAALSLEGYGGLFILGSLVSACAGIVGAGDQNQSIPSVVFVAAMLLFLILGISFLRKGGERGKENIKKTTRPAWKHVSAGDVVAAHKRAEEAAERATRAADKAASESRNTARRSIWDD